MTATATEMAPLRPANDALTLTSEDAADVVADTDNKAPRFEDLDTEMDGRQTDQERSVPENYASVPDLR